jgi:hypothetical protein
MILKESPVVLNYEFGFIDRNFKFGSIDRNFKRLCKRPWCADFRYIKIEKKKSSGVEAE